jgi:putative NADH-flavin reductase
VKVTLFGASGMVGARILDELLNRGHEVTAVVRNPERISTGKQRLTVLSGDAFDAGSVRDSARGSDILVTAVAMRDDAQRDDPARNPVDLIRTAAGVADGAQIRFFAMGGAGSLEIAPGLQLVDSPEFPADYKPESGGFRDALTWLRAESPAELSWTMISPPIQIEPDSPRTGKYRTGTDSLLTDAEGASRISAADLAVAVVDEVETSKHPRSRFTVAY